MRAVIYARYSTEFQREASLDDQVRLCRERCEREGWEVVQVYQDRALSGASAFRAGYQALLADGRNRGFDVVVAEALDRLSRDQEDVAGMYKRLRFAGVQIVTLAEGEVSELHVGLKGTMNAIFLKDLAAKTHRGLRGRVAEGLSAGGLCFGYNVVRRTDERGEPICGEREVNQAHAILVRRIFELFAGGSSPIAIAKQLNAEGHAGPQGKAWRDTTIRGHAARGTGILRNELYLGRLVWNRMRFVKDPATGRRISRPNPPEQWITEDVPHLQIVDHDLWNRAQARLAGIREHAGANKPDRVKFWDKRRAQHLLSGKCFCASCGGSYANVGRDYLACTTARRQGVCANQTTIRRPDLEKIVFEALQTQLMKPEQVALFVTEYSAEWNRLQAESEAGRDGMKRELDTVQRKLSGLIDAISEGMRAPGLQQKLDELETRKKVLESGLASHPGSAPRLHPGLAERYREKVEHLGAVLAGPDGTAALEAARALIDRVILGPSKEGSGLEIELLGDIASMVRLADDARRLPLSAADRGLFDRSVKVVAGIGFEPMTFRL